MLYRHRMSRSAADAPATAPESWWENKRSRLQAEHVVVHELLERQIETLNAMVTEPSPAHFADAVEVYEALERVLSSHLGYEEAQIGDALGYYGLF